MYNAESGDAIGRNTIVKDEKVLTHIFHSFRRLVSLCSASQEANFDDSSK